MWQNYVCVDKIETALELLAEHSTKARVVAGATDIILELERDQRPEVSMLLDITRLPGLDQIYEDDKGLIHLGCLVTHNQCAASSLIIENAFPLAQAAWEVGAPQIRNCGTIAGNLITASPANDTITPLIALDASVVLVSKRGQRIVPLREFYIGVRRTVMAPDEMMTEILIPAIPVRGAFMKIGLRKAQAISVVNACVILKYDHERVADARITLGAVAPTIIRAYDAEEILKNQVLTEPLMAEAASLAMSAARPIDDLRGSAAYRREMVRVAVLRLLHSLAEQEERHAYPTHPVLLSRSRRILTRFSAPQFFSRESQKVIETTINGKPYRFSTGHHKTLLRLLREDAGLIGTKEGCAEGECGACTVYLDGQAVMSCMVPAPRAHHAVIETIEGLTHDEELHPVQLAFIEAGAVQCGYCTPGFVMSAAMLLEEKPSPDRQDVVQALTGNLCRCTGYYKIIEAIEKCGWSPTISQKEV